MNDHQPGDDRSESRVSPRTADLTYEFDDERASAAVVRAVASLTNASIVDLDPLYEVIDPEHLDALFGGAHGGTAGTDRSVTFVFHGCRVTVTRDTVHVRECDGASN